MNDAAIGPAAKATIHEHPGFRDAVEWHAKAHLAHFEALGLIERWMVGDVGRASLSSAAWLLAAQGRLNQRALMTSPPVASGQVSRGRARLYLHQAIANDLLVRVDGGDELTTETPLMPAPRFHAVMAGILGLGLAATARVAPEAAPALTRLADQRFALRLSLEFARLHIARPWLFPLERPLRLFHDRNGGVAILSVLLARQRPGRRRLMETCEVSRSALARAGHCSRAHIIRLLLEAENRGLVIRADRTIEVTALLSDDVEHYFANLFVGLGGAAMAALADG